MNERREFNAPSVDAAIEIAASFLNVLQSSLHYSVLDEGSLGFLGLGARDARILVDPPEEETLELQSTPSVQGPTSSRSSTEIDEGVREEGEGTPLGEAYGLETSGEHDKASEELLAEIKERIETTLYSMAFDGMASVRDEGEIVKANIESEDSRLFIGQKGETIDAVQYLINIFIYREQRFSKKIVLDCDGYRERRENAVQGMAHRTAKRVSKERRATDLPPMNSSERRAVHAYLKENPSVTTSSVGNDANRRVTISPAQ